MVHNLRPKTVVVGLLVVSNREWREAWIVRSLLEKKYTYMIELFIVLFILTK